MINILGSLLKWVLLALWEMKEKSHEAIEVTTDPAVRDRIRNAKRL
jgi:hypothetical protein